MTSHGLKEIEIEIGELKKLVEARTHRRIRDLAVEMQNGDLVLKGRVPTYHLKQLAQHGILDVLPGVQLVNAIEVWN